MMQITSENRKVNLLIKQKANKRAGKQNKKLEF